MWNDLHWMVIKSYFTKFKEKKKFVFLFNKSYRTSLFKQIFDVFIGLLMLFTRLGKSSFEWKKQLLLIRSPLTKPYVFKNAIK